MKITLKSKDWQPGEITVYETKQTICADSAEGPVTLVYERSNRNPRAYSFRGVQRSRPNPASQFAGDLAPIIDHLPWTAVAPAAWKRAMTDEQQRRSYHD
jgi:hypothetical protein